MVSLGPYHHGKSELHQAEEFKYLCLDWCAVGNEEKKGLFYNNIIEKIAEIRECYAEVGIVEKYDDEALALMMLLDACFIISFMRIFVDTTRNNILDWRDCFGFAFAVFMIQDIMVLENQIPFQVLKLLITLQCDEKEEAEGFLPKYLSFVLQIDAKNANIPEEIEEPPLHFLEAYWRVVTKKDIINNDKRPFLAKVHDILVASKSQKQPRLLMRKEKDIPPFNLLAYRSVSELKAKGIRFRPSSDFSRSFMNITFTSRAFDGELRLPFICIYDGSSNLLSNLIAYEATTNSRRIRPVVSSYVMLMKSLIQSTEDVRELQEKGILLNIFANLEKAVELFKEIDTIGLHCEDFFVDVKRKIEEHCNSKAKTWIADLIHTRFQTPWTAIALFAAVFLLCLTFLQTFYTIRPVK